MIRLLINGQEVALPDDFSSTLYEENPVFTKNEKYTYDFRSIKGYSVIYYQYCTSSRLYAIFYIYPVYIFINTGISEIVQR
ncbi:hypothetical protein LDB17_07885, partial [Dysgonomonas sp. Shenzhen-Wh21]|uniref:hypothetical protein n=1 Tax=Dysgonomonas sp. Shenzhen-Wh21 TaxID=2878548 RepID=UPI00372D6699